MHESAPPLSVSEESVFTVTVYSGVYNWRGCVFNLQCVQSGLFLKQPHYAASNIILFGFTSTIYFCCILFVSLALSFCVYPNISLYELSSTIAAGTAITIMFTTFRFTLKSPFIYTAELLVADS